MFHTDPFGELARDRSRALVAEAARDRRGRDAAGPAAPFRVALGRAVGRALVRVGSFLA